MSHFGWEYWKDAALEHEVKSVRIFRKEGYYCICESGVEPGDAESFVRGGMLSGYAVFWQLVDERRYTPDALTRG